VVRQDRESGIYRKVAFKEDKIVGCILLGNVKGNSEILSAIERRVNMKDLKSLILEEGFDFKNLSLK
jgi:NAD(P)H-nitrite reductase large subunit